MGLGISAKVFARMIELLNSRSAIRYCKLRGSSTPSAVQRWIAQDVLVRHLILITTFPGVRARWSRAEMKKKVRMGGED